MFIKKNAKFHENTSGAQITCQAHAEYNIKPIIRENKKNYFYEILECDKYI